MSRINRNDKNSSVYASIDEFDGGMNAIAEDDRNEAEEEEEEEEGDEHSSYEI